MQRKTSPRAPPIKITTTAVTTAAKAPISQSKLSPRSPTEKKPSMAANRKSPLRSIKTTNATSPVRPAAHSAKPSQNQATLSHHA